jgi:hypothetical protein
MTTIDLTDVLFGRRVLSGRDRGESARDFYGLLDIPLTEDVTVHVPEHLISVNMSFFLGMFSRVIWRLGDVAFRAHYTFTGRDISRTIEASIAESRPPGGFRVPPAYLLRIEKGQLVKTVRGKPNATDWTPQALASRKWGILGVVAGYHDSHGLFYDVKHQDGSMGFYEPHELEEQK